MGKSKKPGLPADEITPAHLDSMMSVIEVKTWIALGTILVVLGTAVVWGFFGTMQVKEDTTGVLVRSGKIFDVYAGDDAVLLDFNLAPEQNVQKDQVVARIEQIDLVEEINLMIAQGAPELEIESKREQLLAKTQIRVIDAGRVVDVYAHAGDYVRKGQKIATISKEAPGSKAMECLLFMPAEQIKNVKRGMDVNIFPASVSSKNYGNMTGTVEFISERPLTFNYLFDVLGNEELVNEMMREGAIYEVYVYLDTSEETVTGYKWTTSYGPNKPFGSLTLCDASIIIEEVRPIDIFFFD